MKNICSNTYWNTLTTTVALISDNTTFIITGDIDDMWIRDSTEQIQQYIPLMKKYKWVQLFIKGLIIKQAKFIHYDPWANSYQNDKYCYNVLKKKLIFMPHEYVATRDLEIDSGAFFIKLVYQLYQHGNDKQFIHLPIIRKAFKSLIKLWKLEQYHNIKSNYEKDHIFTQLLNFTGMIYTSNRPSDDHIQYGFHIPK